MGASIITGSVLVSIPTVLLKETVCLFYRHEQWIWAGAGVRVTHWRYQAKLLVYLLAAFLWFFLTWLLPTTSLIVLGDFTPHRLLPGFYYCATNNPCNQQKNSQIELGSKTSMRLPVLLPDLTYLRIFPFYHAVLIFIGTGPQWRTDLDVLAPIRFCTGTASLSIAVWWSDQKVRLARRDEVVVITVPLTNASHWPFYAEHLISSSIAVTSLFGIE